MWHEVLCANVFLLHVLAVLFHILKKFVDVNKNNTCLLVMINIHLTSLKIATCSRSFITGFSVTH